MQRSRDLRSPTTSAVNGFSRGDSTDEDREMGLHEAVRLRDRERLQKKDRDREFSKRRKIERFAMQKKNGGEGYRENESTDASDEEYLEGEEDARIHFVNRLDQPSLLSSSLSNNRRNHRIHRSSPALRASVDETIGVPIPRRVRSASIKRLHDYCNSGGGKFGDELSHRRFSCSPASHICAGSASPTASGASRRKQMKSVESRARALSTSNPRPSPEIQDDIEIEVVEALFDLMKQSQSLSQSSKNEDKFDKDSLIAADEGLTKGGKDENKTFLPGYGTSIKVDSETAKDESIVEMKKDERSEKEKFPKDSALQRGNGFLNLEKVLSPKESESPSCVKVDAYEVQDPKVTEADDTATVVEIKMEAKLEIDLMVPPPLTSSLEKDVLGDMPPFPKYMAHDFPKRSESISKDDPVEAINRLPKLDLEKHYDNPSVTDGGKLLLRGFKEQKNQFLFAVQTSLSSLQIALGGWPSVLPHPGYMQSQEAVLPMDDSARLPIAKQLPKFTFSQPRSQKSATHQYIARSIQQHEQLITKSLLSGPTSIAILCESKPLNSNTRPPTQRLIPGSPAIGECRGKQNLGAIGVGSGKEKGSEVPLALNSSKNKELLLQQASLQTTADNFPHNPAFNFPLGYYQTMGLSMTPAKSSGPAQPASASGNMSLRSNSAGRPSVNLSLPGEETVTSFSSPTFASGEVAPNMAALQNNGCQFPISTNMALSQLKGGKSPPLPLFTSSVYSSTMFCASQKLLSSKDVDNNYRSLADTHSTQTEKQQFPPSHSSSKSGPETGRKGSALYADTQQRSTENRIEFIPQPFSASFGLNAPSCPALNFSSMAQNSAIFSAFPGMAWNGYQMAKHKNFLTSDGKSATVPAKIDDGLKRSLGKSESQGSKSSSNDVSPVSMMGISIADGLAGSVNFAPSVASGNQLPFPQSSVGQTSGVLPNLHQHQQQSIQLPKHYMQQMQQTGTAELNASTCNVVAGSFLPGSFAIQNPFFSKVSVQTDDNSSYSHHWQNLPRSSAPEVISQTANFSDINIPQPKSSLGSHSVSVASPQRQQIVTKKQPVLPVGSTSDYSISKNAGGSERSASIVVIADSAISALPSQQIEASPSGSSQKSSPACRGNVPSVLSTCPGQLPELK